MASNDDEKNETPAALVQSVDRAIGILERMADKGGEMGVTELAADLGVHKSTASRLIATLEAHELVEQTQERGKYRLGLGLLRLSGAANLVVDIVSVTRPALRQLVRDVGETANLAILSDGAALYVDQLVGRFSLQAHSWVGQRIPLHATSNGKVLLAYADDAVVEDVVAGGLAVYGPDTITSPATLRKDLQLVRERGWAVAVDELEEGLTAVAAPVFDSAGEVVGSISASGPGFRVGPRLDDLVGATVRCAADASARLGRRSE